MNGKIVISVPTTTKANVRFRTHNGAILTDFDAKDLVTTTSISQRPSRKPRPSAPAVSAAPAPAPTGPNPPISSPTAPATPPDAPAGQAVTKDGSEKESDWKSDLESSLHEAADQVRVAARQAAYAIREGLATTSGRGPELAHPLPPLPPMTGGKIVSGALNGGGTEIQATTMNGDITFRKLEKAP
jgi:hypothetical protein